MKRNRLFVTDGGGAAGVLVAAAILTVGLPAIGEIRLFPVATNPAKPEIAGGLVFAGSNYFVGLVSDTNVLVQKISVNGECEGSPVVVGSNPGFPPAAALAASSTNVLIAWSDRSIETGVSAFGRVWPIGNGTVGPAFNLLSSAEGHGFQAVRAAASDGSGFLVVWEDTATAAYYGQFVSGNGTLSGSKIALVANADEVALRFGSTNYLVAWQAEDANGDTHTYCRTISSTGVLGNPVQISVTGSRDHNPIAIGFDRTNFFVIWNCSSGGNELSLHGRFVSQAGLPVGGELELVAEPAVLAATAFDGANHLVVWSHELPTPAHTVFARFFDVHGKPIGPVFSPLAAGGGAAPLFALNGLIYDGARFVIAATYGDFVVDEHGDVTGFSGGDVYGTFLPSSTTPPAFRGVTIKNGYMSGWLSLVPGVTYTVEISTNLTDWIPAGIVSSDKTDVLSVSDDTPCSENARLFYRVVMGNKVPPKFMFSFLQFARGGTFGASYSPTVHFPVEVSSYSATLSVVNDIDFPEPQSVFFTGPAGSGLVNAPADSMSSRVGSEWAVYQSPMIFTTSGPPGGTWFVNYKGNTVKFDVPDPGTRSHTVLPFPTVAINNGLLESVSWVYRDAATGATLPGAPTWLVSVQVQIESNQGNRIYNSTELSPNVTYHVLTSPIAWSEVIMVHMAYQDSLGNHYVVSFEKR